MPIEISTLKSNVRLLQLSIAFDRRNQLNSIRGLVRLTFDSALDGYQIRLSDRLHTILCRAYFCNCSLQSGPVQKFDIKPCLLATRLEHGRWIPPSRRKLCYFGHVFTNYRDLVNPGWGLLRGQGTEYKHKAFTKTSGSFG